MAHLSCKTKAVVINLTGQRKLSRGHEIHPSVSETIFLKQLKTLTLTKIYQEDSCFTPNYFIVQTSMWADVLGYLNNQC